MKIRKNTTGNGEVKGGDRKISKRWKKVNERKEKYEKRRKKE